MIQGLGKNIPWFYFNIKIAGLSRKNSSQEKTALRDLSWKSRKADFILFKKLLLSIDLSLQLCLFVK